jgi:hypothetical protein
MIKCSYTNTSKSHNEIIDYVKNKKIANPLFKVIDIGGGVNGWTRDIVDVVVDIRVEDTAKTLQVDICNEQDYGKILDYVQANGIFDYCICTHTLEDLYNPFPALINMPKFAKAGVITMPSMTDELSPVQNLAWNGYLHHRWMYEYLDGRIYIIPKIYGIEAFISSRMSRAKGSEIKYEWGGAIPYSIFMNNYLGPDILTVTNELRKLVEKLNLNSRGEYKFNNIHTRPRRYLMRLVRFIKMRFGLNLNN